MDLETIQREAHKIADIVDEWSYQRNIPSLERDLVLEKLMSLYDMVRFSAKRVETETAGRPHVPSCRQEEPGMQALNLEAAYYNVTQPHTAAPVAAPATAVTPTAAPVEEFVEMTAPKDMQPVEVAPAPVQPVAEAQPHEEPLPAPQATAEDKPTETIAEEPTATPNLTHEEAPVTPDPLELHKQKQRLILSLYDMETAPETSEQTPSPAAPAPHTDTLPMSGFDAPTDGEDDDEEDNDPFEVISMASVAAIAQEIHEASHPEPSVAAATIVEPAPKTQMQAVTEEQPSPAAAPTVATEQPAAAPEPLRNESSEQEQTAETLAPHIMQESVTTPSEEHVTAPHTDIAQEIATTQEPPLTEERVPAVPEAPQAVISDVTPHPVEQLYDEEDEEEDDLSDEEAISVITPDPLGRECDRELHTLYHNDEIPEGAVLGEVINAHVQTLGESIQVSHDTVSEVISSDRTDDLLKAIGINDKFLMIHDLFGGDSDAYDRVIATLNQMESLDDALIYIAEHFSWNPNSDGAKLLEALLERKFRNL